ncbi:MAG: OsmC family protein [Deltaproteobacteria bacterium]|nr:OsmC family protein [Deltaproteobacteria bacterium]
MKKTFEVSFPGGKRVDARIGERIIRTDQDVREGGDGSAPEPFQLFLASIATCAGIYALEFLRAREMDHGNTSLTMTCEFDESGRVCRKLIIDLKLPEDFPDKYRKAVVRTMDLCSVKKHMVAPPEFEIKTS